MAEKGQALYIPEKVNVPIKFLGVVRPNLWVRPVSLGSVRRTSSVAQLPAVFVPVDKLGQTDSESRKPSLCWLAPCCTLSSPQQSWSQQATAMSRNQEGTSHMCEFYLFRHQIYNEPALCHLEVILHWADPFLCNLSEAR